MKKLNVLCLDIEGGHGGSSKSLYNSLKYIDQKNIKPFVICKKSGLEQQYKALGIMCIVDKTMPTFTALRKQNRNILFYFIFKFYIWPKSRKFRKNLLHIINKNNINLVHCNLISLFLLARWLKKIKPDIILTLHVRTNPVNTYTGRFQAKVSNSVFSNKIFITENEKEKMDHLLYPKKAKGKLIYNSVEVNKKALSLHKNKISNPIKIASLSNYSYPRGTDRLIDLAQKIPDEEKKNFKFYIAGDYKLPRFLPHQLRFLALRGKTLEDYAKLKKVNNMFTFLGHVKDTESLLNEVNILIRPTREYNPWGRDVLEAMSAGKTIISIGTYEQFVKTDYTGLLQPEFNIEELVDWLVSISKNTNRLSKYGRNSINIIKKINNPERNAHKLKMFWLNTYAKHSK